ncbi:hypothetical protein HDE_04393 [Halotydeus destructor]|nr:hypothetical protein HDE_04393 [Halotydeus destructor]
MPTVSIWTKFSELQNGPTYVSKGDGRILQRLLINVDLTNYLRDPGVKVSTSLSAHCALNELETLGYTVCNFITFKDGASGQEELYFMWTLHKPLDA